MAAMHPNRIPPEQFLGLFFGVLAAGFGVGALLRKAQGQPFFRPKLAGVELREGWISGRSSRGLLGSLSHANNCLWFMLTADVLRVGAHFPFNMFMLGFVIRFDLEIPVAAITAVRETSRFLSGKWVRVDYEYADRDGRPKSAWVELRARRGSALVEALREKARSARATLGKSFG
jgi:hypothetical protein